MVEFLAVFSVQTEPRANARLIADAALVFTAVIWGFAFVFQKSAMSFVGPLAFIAARAVVAAVALGPLAYHECRRAPQGALRGLLPVAVLGGIAFFGGAWLQQAGLVTATVTNTGFLTALYVVITPFIAWAVNGTAPGRLVWPAAALSALGTWLLGGGTLSRFSQGDFLVALSAFVWAAHVVITARAAHHGRPITFNTVQFVVVALLALPASTLLETTTLHGLRAAALDIAYVGLLSSALTFTIFTAALKHTPPSEGAVIASTETLFAALAAFWLLGERLAPVAWSGAALILTATVLVQIGGAAAARRLRVRRA
jgi:drug/metabolite transporter (DMT)-like permease